MLKTIYSTVLGGLSKYLTAILSGLLLATGLATAYIYHELDGARLEAASALETSRQYQALADTRKAALEAAEARHRATINSLNHRAATAERQARQYKDKHDALSKALDSDRGWTDTPISAGVAAALGRPAGGR